jgi:ribosomal protein S18 acetylase RimI-like enzyme
MDEQVTFEVFDPPAFNEWLARSESQYIGERVAAGDTPDEATANADASIRSTFPDRLPAPGQLAGFLVWDGRRIGELWVGQSGPDPQRWWVWDIRVDEVFRGRGLGRESMLLAEELARANGAVSIGLNVFAHNTVARNLYTSLGYRETSVQMRKDITRHPDQPDPTRNYSSPTS